MKLKDVFLGLCVAALLISEFFLFSANRQKDAAQTALRDANQQVGQLQSDLQQIKASSVNARNMEFARLRNGNQDLPRLRSAIQQLTETNRALAEQLKAVRAVAQQQQGQLQELQAENQQVQQVEASSDPQPMTPDDAQREACINNLRQIDAAKQEWALENNKTANAIPTSQNLRPYFKDGILPVCPGGGIYTINAVGEPPTCSIPGHALPQ
jgi:chromosome segregation ATPase